MYVYYSCVWIKTKRKHENEKSDLFHPGLVTGLNKFLVLKCLTMFHNKENLF